MNKAIIHVILSFFVSIVILIALFIVETIALTLINPEDTIETIIEEHWFIYLFGIAVWFWGSYQYWTTNESVWGALFKIYGVPFNNQPVIVQSDFYASFFRIQNWDSSALINANVDGLIMNDLSLSTIYIPWSDIKNVAVITERNGDKNSVITLKSQILDAKTFEIKWNAVLDECLPSTIKCIEREK